MRPERWLVLSGLGMFVLCLFLPSLTSPSFPVQSGLDLFHRGPELWRDGIIAWYANPALLLTLVLTWFGRYRAGLVTAGLALLLALSTLTGKAVIEASGRSVPEFSYGIGFYVWLLAFVAAAVAAGIGIYKVSGSSKRQISDKAAGFRD